MEAGGLTPFHSHAGARSAPGPSWETKPGECSRLSAAASLYIWIWASPLSASLEYFDRDLQVRREDSDALLR